MLKNLEYLCDYYESTSIITSLVLLILSLLSISLKCLISSSGFRTSSSLLWPSRLSEVPSSSLELVNTNIF